MERNRIKLEELERKQPFSVPDGYFEELPSIIQSRIPSKAEVRPLWSTKQVASWVAAATVLAGMFWVTLPIRQGPLEPDALVAVSDDAIVEYLHNQDMDYFDLAQQSAVQKAFSDEATLLNYLEYVDDTAIEEQLQEMIDIDEYI